MSTTPGSQSITLPVDNLFYSDVPVVTEAAVIASGQEIARGAVLGKVTSTGELKLSTAGASDGSETPYAIAADTVDATEGEQATIVYLKGHFNTRALSLGTGLTLAGIKPGLRQLGIYLSESADPTDPVTEDSGS